MAGEAKPSRITEGTLLPFSLVIFVMSGTIGATIWVTTWMSTVNETLRNVTKAIGVSVTRTEFKLWSSELKISNPAIVVPDPQKVFTESKKSDDLASH